MARKLEQPTAVKAAPESTAQPAGVDDLAILHPDITVAIAGRTVTVREYGFLEGLRVRAFMHPFTSDLGTAFADGGEVLVEDVLDLLGDHIELIQRAIAQSMAPTDAQYSQEDLDWIQALDDADGDLLVNLWWGTCGLFFVRQVMRRTAERMRRATFAGPMSTALSSTPASAPPSDSVTTPSGSSSSSTTAAASLPTGARLN